MVLNLLILKPFKMISLSRKPNLVFLFFVLFTCLLVSKTNETKAQNLSITTTISPTLNAPQTVGTTFAYITIIQYNGPVNSSIDAVLSVELTGLVLDGPSIAPQGIGLITQRPGVSIWDIQSMASGSNVTFNFPATITSTGSSAIIKSTITMTTADIDPTNNVAAVQTFIKPILTQPSNTSICSDQLVNIPLSSDNPFTAYAWSSTPSTNTITVQPSGNAPIVKDIVKNIGSTSGTILYTVTPAITCTIVLPDGSASTTLVTTLGDPKAFTVTVQPIGIITAVSVTHDGTIYYGSDAVFTPNSNLASSIYRWYDSANKAGGPISNNAVLTKPLLLIGEHTYYVTVASSGSPFCEGAPFPATVNVTPRPVHPENLFTPDNDEANDKWAITNIDQFPYCTVLVLDEWGKKVYFAPAGYTNPWDGTFENKPLPASTYYYIIDLKDGSKPFGGSVTILRK